MAVPKSELSHVVRKAFNASGERLLSGRCVRARDFRNLSTLVGSRYLEVLPRNVDPVPGPGNSWWESAAALRWALKSGGRSDTEPEIPYAAASYNDLRAEAKKRGLEIGGRPKKKALVAALTEDDATAGPPESEVP